MEKFEESMLGKFDEGVITFKPALTKEQVGVITEIADRVLKLYAHAQESNIIEGTRLSMLIPIWLDNHINREVGCCELELYKSLNKQQLAQVQHMYKITRELVLKKSKESDKLDIDVNISIAVSFAESIKQFFKTSGKFDKSNINKVHSADVEKRFVNELLEAIANIEKEEPVDKVVSAKTSFLKEVFVGRETDSRNAIGDKLFDELAGIYERAIKSVGEQLPGIMKGLRGVDQEMSVNASIIGTFVVNVKRKYHI